MLDVTTIIIPHPRGVIRHHASGKSHRSPPSSDQCVKDLDSPDVVEQAKTFTKTSWRVCVCVYVCVCVCVSLGSSRSFHTKTKSLSRSFSIRKVGRDLIDGSLGNIQIPPLPLLGDRTQSSVISLVSCLVCFRSKGGLSMRSLGLSWRPWWARRSSPLLIFHILFMLTEGKIDTL